MKHRPLCIVCLCFILVQCVLLYAGGGVKLAQPPASSIFSKLENEKRNVTVSGILYRQEIRSDYQILYLKNNIVNDSITTYREKKILVYDDSFCNVHIGNRLSLKGSATAFDAARNPGNFNMQLYYAKDKLYGSVYAKKVNVTNKNIEVFSDCLNRLRLKWNAQILECLGEEQGGVLCAMLTGEKSVMPEDTKKLYQANGVSHLLAISGLHISFIGLGIYQLLRRLGLGIAPGSVISVFVLWCYVAMIGSPVSACRAAIMLVLRIGADICGRDYDMATALALSAMITVLREKLYLVDAGFLLSYCAILGILLVAPVMKKILPDLLARRENFIISLSVQVMLFPLLLYYYFEISTYGIFINLLVLPLMAPLLGLGIIASVISCVFKMLGATLFLGCKGILSVISYLLKLTNHLPYANVVLGKPAFSWVLMYYVCLLVLVITCVYLRMNKKSKRRLLLGATVTFVMFLVLQIRACINPGEVSITFMDVGQGDGIFVRGPKGGTYLIDGGSSDISKVGKYRILPFLQSKGVSRIDYVFVTHGDADHYSGILELMDESSVKIDSVLLPSGYQRQEALLNLAKKASQKNIQTQVLEPGIMISEGDLKIECLQPYEKDDFRDTNEASMVLDLSLGEFDVLFAGDLEGEGEALLEKRLKKSNYELLKAFHHGSKNANGEKILSVIQPERVVISAGVNNDYGHPAAETVKRFQRWTDRIYNTAQNGAIMIKSDGKMVFGGF